MELSEEIHIAMPLSAVWENLNDPDVLKLCLPGCERFDVVGENQFEIEMLTKVGPVKARFKGNVELSDIVHLESYRLSGAGKGGVAGFAKGAARVTLERVEQEGETVTRMAYEVEAAVGGKIAQLGSRLIRGVARKMANDFFTRFTAEVTGDTGGEQGPADKSAG